jgi:DNA-binding response OmpR family regulator
MGNEGFKTKVLLIDDDKRFAESVAKLLAIDHSIILAHDSTEGHRILVQARPDLLLLDFGLPGLSGLEVLKILRRRMIDLPIIMLTGESGADTIIETMKAGATDYIIKGSDDFEVNLPRRHATMKCTEVTRPS